MADAGTDGAMTITHPNGTRIVTNAKVDAEVKPTVFESFSILYQTPERTGFHLCGNTACKTPVTLFMIQSAMSESDVMQFISIISQQSGRVEVYIAPLGSSNDRGSPGMYALLHRLLAEVAKSSKYPITLHTDTRGDITRHTDTRGDRGYSFIQVSSGEIIYIPTKKTVEGETVKFTRFPPYPTWTDVRRALCEWYGREVNLTDHVVDVKFPPHVYQSYMADLRAWFWALYHSGEPLSDQLHLQIDNEIIAYLKSRKYPDNHRGDVKDAFSWQDPDVNDADDACAMGAVCPSASLHIAKMQDLGFYKARE